MSLTYPEVAWLDEASYQPHVALLVIFVFAVVKDYWKKESVKLVSCCSHLALQINAVVLDEKRLLLHLFVIEATGVSVVLLLWLLLVWDERIEWCQSCFSIVLYTHIIYIYTHCNTRSNKGICLITTMYFYWEARASRQNAFIMASAHYTVRCWYCSLKKSQQFFHMFTNHCQCCNQINNFTKGDDRGTPLWSCTSPQRCKLSK